ncbi:MAG TPA: LacI family DNA-binding transcriptional regulator [Opitutaceae bacterium]|jgi:LacI family transcriptional regulator
MKSRVTQSHIARAAGVHNTTVSLALRNSPAIPEATRKRIQSIAQELGYAPDPALQALIAYRKGCAPDRREDTLAYVTHWYSKHGWEQEPGQASYFAGAQRKAAQCGYRLEHFDLGDPELSPRRLSHILFHRGITGILFAAFRHDCTAIPDFDWGLFSSVAIGCFPQTPSIHRVMENQRAIMRQAMRRLAGAGYRRIGLVLASEYDRQADGAWSASFLAEQMRIPSGMLVPPFCFEQEQSMQRQHVGPAGTLRLDVALARWIEEHAPEVVISVAPGATDHLARLSAGVFHEVSWVDLMEGTGSSKAPLYRNICERVGEVAIETLADQLQQNVRGIQDIAKIMLLETGLADSDLESASLAAWQWSPERMQAVP